MQFYPAIDRPSEFFANSILAARRIFSAIGSRPRQTPTPPLLVVIPSCFFLLLTYDDGLCCFAASPSGWRVTFAQTSPTPGFLLKGLRGFGCMHYTNLLLLLPGQAGARGLLLLSADRAEARRPGRGICEARPVSETPFAIARVVGKAAGVPRPAWRRFGNTDGTDSGFLEETSGVMLERSVSAWGGRWDGMGVSWEEGDWIEPGSMENEVL